MSPTVILVLAWTGLILAAIPALLTRANLRLFRPPPEPPADVAVAKVSVLVPARNEAQAIGRLMDDVLASQGVELELVILDDSSSDATGSIVAARAARDPRVRLVAGRPLPAGWCGKQHACWQLAEAARHDLWVFLDVDVSPAPDAIRRGIAFLEASGADLASGFPRQETGSLLEWLLLPLINFVLLGYLPIARSREVNSPSLAAGCGQFFITRRAAYEQAGGHAVIRASLHDGVKLPRAYRRVGLVTDIFDATPIASCRMYDRSIDVWRGLSKNATEGIGSAATILPFTLLLGGGQILPPLLAAYGLATGFAGWPVGGGIVAVIAAAVAYLPRLLDAIRFRQRLSSVVFQPLAVAVFLAIQWIALARKALGLQTRWRGRSLAPQ
ncbi:MAG: glycosyltransferase family 2 protein [Planctomycetota bacterium]|nr:glycosyltransferase family 2 protein [Planctomycetota bacterium]MDA1201013.1 glycosyltransferase family 2 protein [Planctomycetota bacterium]